MRELDTPASDSYNQRFGGTRRLYGNSEVDILRAAHVCVIGIGGVGFMGGGSAGSYGDR